MCGANSFYEKLIKDQSVLSKGIQDGKFLEGTIYFDPKISTKGDGFVKVEGIKNAVKVRGLQYLNRAFHLDRVVVKFVNWVIWEKAQAKFTRNIDFEEESSYQSPFIEVSQFTMTKRNESYASKQLQLSMKSRKVPPKSAYKKTKNLGDDQNLQQKDFGFETRSDPFTDSDCPKTIDSDFDRASKIDSVMMNQMAAVGKQIDAEIG